MMHLQHADLGPDEIDNTLSTLGSRLWSKEEPGSTSDIDMAEREPAGQRDWVQEAIEGREPAEVSPSIPSVSQAKDPPKGAHLPSVSC